MTNKLLYLTKISLNKKIKTKWFLWANIILAIAIISLVNIDSIIKFFGGDFNDNINILVIDNTNELYNDFDNIYQEFDELSVSTVTITKYDKSLEEAKEEIKDKDDLILEINYDLNNYISANLTANEHIDPTISSIISYTLNTLRTNIALEKYNLSNDILIDINKQVILTKTILDKDSSSDSDMDLIMNIIFPILILPFFMLTMFLVQMIGAEINEEKTTKSMEIIISNVSPKTHFLSKLIAGNSFVLLQGLLLIFYMILGIGLRMSLGGLPLSDSTSTSFVTEIYNNFITSDFISKLHYIIPITLLLMIATFVAYSLVAAILASMTTNIEDFQQLQSPIIIISLAGYYLAILAGMFNGSILIKILSYLPFLSALLVPSLLSLGQIGIIDVLISSSVLILTIYLLMKYGLRIYKQGILNYSSTNLWKKMFKALKNK